MFIINLMKIESNTELVSVIFNLSVTKVYHLLIIMAWFMLRGVSFGLENINYLESHLRDDNKFSLINFLGYSYYFPTILFGPNVIYSRYMDMLKLPNNESVTGKITRFFKLLSDVSRYSFWYFFTAFCLHYFYIHVVQTNSQVSVFRINYI
jgi:D-alanyl-lipoteichoic acid acyltransferase DltB (MBOAT superfamily)